MEACLGSTAMRHPWWQSSDGIDLRQARWWPRPSVRQPTQYRLGRRTTCPVRHRHPLDRGNAHVKAQERPLPGSPSMQGPEQPKSRFRDVSFSGCIWRRLASVDQKTCGRPDAGNLRRDRAFACYLAAQVTTRFRSDVVWRFSRRASVSVLLVFLTNIRCPAGSVGDRSLRQSLPWRAHSPDTDAQAHLREANG